MTDKNNPSDEDRAALERMMASREESRRKREAAGAAPAAKPEGDLARRWKDETFGGGEDEDGLFASLPPATPVGIVAIDGPGGVTLYRDGRCRFSIAIPGKPRFVAADEGIDATCRLGDVAISLSIVMVPPQAETPLDAQVATLASDITQAAAAAVTLEAPGIEAAARAMLVQGSDVREVVVLAGGAGDSRAIEIVLFDYDRGAVSETTASAVRDAVVGSAAFTVEPRRRIPALVIP
jgi:hypothetical protein